MAKDTAVLDQGNTASWETGLKTPTDILLLFAHHNQNVLNTTIDELKAISSLTINHVEIGKAYRNKAGDGIEHFGYVDGRSQPLMMQSDIDKEKVMDGISEYNPSAPLGQFIFEDPMDAQNGYGSFFVFRKLEQNVKGFKEKEKELANDLRLDGEDKERSGAMVVGRFEDGTPLTKEMQASGRPVTNNFNYDTDQTGSRCPFQGHIRKSNPRGSSPGGLEFDKSVQMARRGITYGERTQDPDSLEFTDKPTENVGLLFMSYQASIERQFRFIQTSWVNSESFPVKSEDEIHFPGIDPIIGQISNKNPIEQRWFPQFNCEHKEVKSLFEGFVNLKGGEYFYAPSLSGIKKL
jgi:Dyp-type peroxidase family